MLHKSNLINVTLINANLRNINQGEGLMMSDSDLDLEPKNKHGGFRVGAGRKHKRKTVVMRVPEDYKAAINHLIAHLNENQMIDHNYSASTSEPMFMRSLLEKRQMITITVSPVKKA